MTMVIKTINGIDITVTGDGRFTAEINGKKRSSATLAEIERKIRGSKPIAVKAILVESYRYINYRVLAIDVGKIERGDRPRMANGNLCSTNRDAYLYDEEAYARLSGIESQMLQLIDQFNTTLYGLTKLTTNNFPDIAEKEAPEEQRAQDV